MIGVKIISGEIAIGCLKFTLGILNGYIKFADGCEKEISFQG